MLYTETMNSIISPKQKNANDLIDDIVHEFAHHVETYLQRIFIRTIELRMSFLKKRQELKFELQVGRILG